MRHAVQEDFAVFHGLHLLAEIHGHEACPILLRLLALHPDAVDFWLGEVNAYIPLIARIIADDLPACMAWLRQPAIECRSKGMVTEAMEQIAKSDPARLPEISAGLGEVLAFLLDSPPQDNILDTGYLFILIGTLAELRTTEHLPIIRKAYDKDLIELFKVGAFEEVSEDMSKPMSPPKRWLPMARLYKDYTDCEDGGDDEEEGKRTFPCFRHCGFHRRIPCCPPPLEKVRPWFPLLRPLPSQVATTRAPAGAARNTKSAACVERQVEDRSGGRITGYAVSLTQRTIALLLERILSDGSC